jgi:hypothetical protein
MRKNRLVVLGCIILIVLVWQAMSFMAHGRINVATDNPLDTIYIKQAGADGFIKTGHTNVSSKLKTGKYIISVQGNSLAATQVVNLKSRQKLNLRINPVKASGVEPVSDQNASNIMADSENLSALDPITGNLYRIDSTNKITMIAPDQTFRSVQWVNPLKGIAQDTSGRLYLVSQTTVSPLNIPFGYDQPVNYTVTSDGSMYISSGSTVYKGGETGFKKIYSASAPPSILAAQKSNLAVVEELEGNGQDNSRISIISGGQVSVKKTGSFVAAWSPGGDYLVISGQEGGEVIDVKSKHVATLPHPNLSSPIWLDDNSLVYGVSDQLWSYDIQTQQGRLIANMPLGATISGVSLTPDKSFLYLTARSITDGSRAQIKRVGLKGQSVDKTVYLLQNIMPQNVNSCFLDLINFTKPTVTVLPGTPACLQTAQTKLQQSGFNPGTLTIVTAP